MSLASRLLAGALILADGACESSPTGVFGNEGLKATVVAPHLTLSNESGQTIRYIVMEAELAPLANWCLCAGGPTLEPGGRVTLAYSAIAGYEAGRPNTALIYWGAESSPDQPAINAEHIKVIPAKL